MNTIGFVIGLVIIFFSGLMLYFYINPPQMNEKNSTAIQKLDSWKDDFGTAAYLFTLVVPFTSYGIVWVLASFELTRTATFILQPFLLLICAIIIAYFYFSKRRNINQASEIAQKVLSDMRGVGIWLGLYAVIGNWFYAVLGTAAVEFILKLTSKKEPAEKTS